jgi:hypothetical protein
MTKADQLVTGMHSKSQTMSYICSPVVNPTAAQRHAETDKFLETCLHDGHCIGGVFSALCRQFWSGSAGPGWSEFGWFQQVWKWNKHWACEHSSDFSPARNLPNTPSNAATTKSVNIPPRHFLSCRYIHTLYCYIVLCSSNWTDLAS